MAMAKVVCMVSLVCCSYAVAHAGSSFDLTATNNLGYGWEYEYTLNDATYQSGYTASLSNVPGLFAWGAPAGWNASGSGDTVTYTYNGGGWAGLADFTPFKIESSNAPGGMIDWGTVEGDKGSVAGPTPELSSASLLLFGMLPMGLAWWRRRRA